MIKYIDSNIFLNALIKEGVEKNEAIKTIEKITTGRIKAATSTLTWDEIVHVIKRFFGKEIAEKQGSKFLKMPNLKFIPPTKEIILGSQELYKKYNIGPRDAIHAATTLSINAEIISKDSDFDKIKEIKRFSSV